MTADGGARGHGFTLLEVLIAIAIVALLSLLGYRALASLSESESRLALEGTKWRTLDLFFSRLEGDLREAIPRPARSGAVTEPSWLAGVDANGNGALAFSRAGPEFALDPGSGGQRLGYRLRNGNIEVLYWPGFDRPRESEPAPYTLLSGVTQFRLTYLTASGRWIDSWPLPGEGDLPRAARVLITLSSGEEIQRWLALR
ncbi:MAG TPA: type II secretion system minor pseudopilin GspJ [Casimicrobiaceae bacterium]|jgi:general secretion pathway protein J